MSIRLWTSVWCGQKKFASGEDTYTGDHDRSYKTEGMYNTTGNMDRRSVWRYTRGGPGWKSKEGTAFYRIAQHGRQWLILVFIAQACFFLFQHGCVIFLSEVESLYITLSPAHGNQRVAPRDGESGGLGGLNK